MERKLSKSTIKSTKLSAIPSSSSKNTVIKGPKYTRWDIEVPKSTEPYHKRLFEVPFKPPPNELTFIGGLGSRKPKFRSKVHPTRPTLVQKLRRQRTGNRINFSLTEDPLPASQSIPKRKQGVEPTKNYVDRVCFADNLESPKSPRSLSPISSGSSNKKLNPTSLNQPCRHDSFLSVPDDPAEKYLSTKRRASAQGLLQDLQQFSLDPDSPRENDILDFIHNVRKGKEIIDPVKMITKNEPKMSDSSKEKEVKQNLIAISHCRKINGALYGPIIGKRRQGIATKLSEKFNLPKDMVDRLANKFNRKDDEAQSKRKSMRGYMVKKLPQSDSSEEDCPEEYEQVKSLKLVRTGYCTIPKIKIGTRRRKDRLKTNRFLDKYQLNRIRYLFFDERQKWHQQPEVVFDKEPPPFLYGQSDPVPKYLSDQKSIDKMGSEKGAPNVYQKLKKFIRNYQSSKDQEENKNNELNFEGYRKGLLDSQLKKDENGRRQKTPTIQKISLFEGDKKGGKNKGALKNFRIAQPPKLFQQTRTRQKFRGVNERDGQYIDPNFMIKQRFPEATTSQQGAYALQCTMRYHTKMRDRLQVNTTGYDEERFGFGETKYLHCLATEWDENYVNELQATKKFKTFRVKTDILRLREVMRKNFNMYYIMENLANLRHKQRHEEAFIDNLNDFGEMCLEYLEMVKVKAYDSLIEKTNNLKPLETATQELEEREKSLKSQLEHATESLLGTEQRWDMIMKCSNYYYALMNTEWRKQNDWIHRKADGQLEVAIYSVDRCRTANIRHKDDPSGFAIIEYFNEHIFPNMDRMRSVRPELQLLKKGLHSLQSEVFTYLNQYNKTLWLYDKIAHTFKTHTEAINQLLEGKQKQIYFRQRKQEFIEERNHVLQYEANQITRKPLEEAIKNLQMRKVAAICDEMYKNVMPLELRSPEIDKKMDTIAKFSRLHEYIVMDVLHKLDKLPVAVLKFTETRTRQERRKVLEEGRAAVVKQTRFELLQKQLRGFFKLLQPATRPAVKSKQKQNQQQSAKNKKLDCKS